MREFIRRLVALALRPNVDAGRQAIQIYGARLLGFLCVLGVFVIVGGLLMGLGMSLKLIVVIVATSFLLGAMASIAGSTAD